MGVCSLWKAGWRDQGKNGKRASERVREGGRGMPVLPLHPFFNAR